MSKPNKLNEVDPVTLLELSGAIERVKELPFDTMRDNARDGHSKRWHAQFILTNAMTYLMTGKIPKEVYQGYEPIFTREGSNYPTAEPADVKVFRLTEFEWVAALDLDSAKAWYLETTGMEAVEAFNDSQYIYEVTDLEDQIFVDDRRDSKQSYRGAIWQHLSQDGATVPFLIAVDMSAC